MSMIILAAPRSSFVGPAADFVGSELSRKKERRALCLPSPIRRRMAVMTGYTIANLREDEDRYPGTPSLIAVSA